MRKKAEPSARESRLATGWTVEAGPGQDAGAVAAAAEFATAGPGTDADGDASARLGAQNEAADHAAERTQVSAGMLVLLGVIGGLYLLYTIVWFSWAQYYSAVNEASAEAGGVVGSFAQRALFWAAPAAPALWFVSALGLNRGERVRKLLLWLLLGAVLLVPLPMFAFGAAQ